MQHHQPRLSAAGASTPGGPTAALPSTSSEYKRGKKRGSYNCGRCGLPKKGHSCHNSTVATTPTDSSADISAPSSLSVTRPPPSRQGYSHLRRALSFDDVDNCGGGDFYTPEPEEDDFDVNMDEQESDPDSGGLPGSCLWEVLRRLPPAGLLSAAKVCKGWRETARRLWRAAEVLKLRVPIRAQVGFVGSVLHKCPGLVSLSLRMERYKGVHLSDLWFYWMVTLIIINDKRLKWMIKIILKIWTFSKMFKQNGIWSVKIIARNSSIRLDLCYL